MIPFANVDGWATRFLVEVDTLKNSPVLSNMLQSEIV
jgi:hypothetical protein